MIARKCENYFIQQMYLVYACKTRIKLFNIAILKYKWNIVNLLRLN